MTDHLPECGQYCDGKPPKCRGGDCTLCDEVDCICSALRACEQRVSDEIWGAIRDGSQYKSGFEGGLDAARDAVAAQREAAKSDYSAPYLLGMADAIAAIDALTDGGCRTPDDPCADPDACDSLTCARERLHLTLRDEADKRERGYLDGHKDGYAAGVQAARDAVAAVPGTGTTVPGEGKVLGRADALAAIQRLLDGPDMTPSDGGER